MTDGKECFFIAPIDDEGTDTRNRTDKLMNYIIKEAVEDYGYSVVRSDKMDTPGSITRQIIGKIVNSELVIADLTDHNPNVFYELAVRHATGKPFIQLIRDNQTIPFDVADQRTIYYGLDVKEAEKTKNEIQAQLESLENGDIESENPISRSADMQSLRESEDPTDQNLAEVFDELSTLTKKVDHIERSINSQTKLGNQYEHLSVPIGNKEYVFNKNKPVTKEAINRIVHDHDITEEELVSLLRNYDLVTPDL